MKERRNERERSDCTRTTENQKRRKRRAARRRATRQRRKGLFRLDTKGIDGVSVTATAAAAACLGGHGEFIP